MKKTAVMSISLPTEMVEKINEMAEKAGISKSLFIQLILRNYIKKEG